MDILIFSKLKIFRSIIFGLVSIFILSACNPFAKNLIIDTKKVLVPTINTIAITSPINSGYINYDADSKNYSVAGTCNEAGQTVTIKVDSVVVTTSKCTRGSFSGTFDITDLSEDDHHFTAHTRNVDSAPIIVTRDVRPPTPPKLYLSLPAYTVGGPITAEWVMSESRDLAYQQIQFYTGECTAEIGVLTDLGLIETFARRVADIRIEDGSTFSYKITSFDNAGNSSTSSCADEMLFYTPKPTIAITSPKSGSYIAIANDSTKFAVNGICSDDTKTVAIKINGDLVETTGGVCDGTNFTSFINSKLILEGDIILTAYYTGAATDLAATDLAATDLAAPDAATDAATSDPVSVTRDVTAPTLSGLSDDATPAKTKTWSWGCSETCTYQYEIDTTLKTILKSDYGSTATDLQKNGDGTYYIHVRAKDAAGNLSEVSHVSAVIDNTAPAFPIGVTVGAYSSSLTASPAVAWGASRDAVDHHEVAIGTTPGAADVKTWTTATSRNTVTGLSLTTNTFYYASVRALDVAGNISTVVTADRWLVDTTAPSAPRNINLGATPTGTAATPTISWREATDASGIASYQAKVFLSADDSELQGWTTLVSGNALALTLSNNTIYYVQVRAIDNAGNVGPATSSDTWTAAACRGKKNLYIYTGAVQAVTVPTDCYSVTAKVWGAGGGGAIVGTGGGGGFAQAKMRVAPGESLDMYVGGGGVGSTINQAGAGGGGDSRIKRSTLSMIVAGGGGGGGGAWEGFGGGNGGPGGGTTGLDGSASVCTGGAGGTPTAGGAAGTTVGICYSGSAGSFNAGGGGLGWDCAWGIGSNCDYQPILGGFNGGGWGGGGWWISVSGGGGGSGYYGGGGGGGNVSSQIGAGGGGGGSSYTTGTATDTFAGFETRAGNNSDTEYGAVFAGMGGAATASGNPGRIVLSWSSDIVTISAPTSISLATISTLTQTPTISWAAITAPGTISYEAAIYKTSDNSEVQTWTPLVSGKKITTVNPLVDGTLYYIKLRAVDNLGNIGTTSVASSSFTAGNI
jgi:hypothetical protein